MLHKSEVQEVVSMKLNWNWNALAYFGRQTKNWRTVPLQKKRFVFQLFLNNFFLQKTEEGAKAWLVWPREKKPFNVKSSILESLQGKPKLLGQVHFVSRPLLPFKKVVSLFGKSSKSPTEVVRNLKDDLLCLEKRAGDPKKLEKVSSSNHDQVFGTSWGRGSSAGKASWIKVPQIEVQLNWHEFNSRSHHGR